MHDLIVAALEKGGINGAEGLVPLACKTGSECDGMLLGNADIEDALRESLAKRSSPVPVGMAAVTATILSSWRASSIRLVPKILV